MMLVLHGYEFSVYNRIVRIALIEKGLSYSRVEVNPFSEDCPPSYIALNPFRRVPTLVHGDFVLYETSAITRYLDETFPTPPLLPIEPCARARVAQVISIIDGYGYWPLVRQVFSHRVFRPLTGKSADEAEVQAGLANAGRVLAALEGLARGGETLVGDGWTMADGHLAAMVDYFTMAPEGAAMLADYPRLAEWWRASSARPSVIATRPAFPQY
ncbi:MAG TPA: glutathione S-transferase family protein [Hyphomicrobiaceae bacterium]|nr:glutathione S-transferase family protein [Hyphomicrobiaceae bacterium]